MRWIRIDYKNEYEEWKYGQGKTIKMNVNNRNVIINKWIYKNN